jgi:hypothetical protein
VKLSAVGFSRDPALLDGREVAAVSFEGRARNFEPAPPRHLQKVPRAGRKNCRSTNRGRRTKRAFLCKTQPPHSGFPCTDRSSPSGQVQEYGKPDSRIGKGWRLAGSSRSCSPWRPLSSAESNESLDGFSPLKHNAEPATCRDRQGIGPEQSRIVHRAYMNCHRSCLIIVDTMGCAHSCPRVVESRSSHVQRYASPAKPKTERYYDDPEILDRVRHCQTESMELCAT